MQIDLTGQATAVSLGQSFYSGVGGQADFDGRDAQPAQHLYMFVKGALEGQHANDRGGGAHN